MEHIFPIYSSSDEFLMFFNVDIWIIVSHSRRIASARLRTAIIKFIHNVTVERVEK